MNNQEYKETLENNLLPFVAKTTNIEEFIFQDDNAPAHRHRNVKEWFKDHNIQTLDWHAQSPDLNPIENLWHFIKLKVAKHKPGRRSDLVRIIKQVWNNEIPANLIENLINSMKKRMIDLKAAHGGHINYSLS